MIVRVTESPGLGSSAAIWKGAPEILDWLIQVTLKGSIKMGGEAGGRTGADPGEAISAPVLVVAPNCPSELSLPGTSLPSVKRAKLAPDVAEV